MARNGACSICDLIVCHTHGTAHPCFGARHLCSETHRHASSKRSSAMATWRLSWWMTVGSWYDSLTALQLRRISWWLSGVSLNCCTVAPIFPATCTAAGSHLSTSPHQSCATTPIPWGGGAWVASRPCWGGPCAPDSPCLPWHPMLTHFGSQYH